jgi:hypothetical protein
MGVTIARMRVLFIKWTEHYLTIQHTHAAGEERLDNVM